MFGLHGFHLQKQVFVWPKFNSVFFKIDYHSHVKFVFNLCALYKLEIDESVLLFICISSMNHDMAIKQFNCVNNFATAKNNFWI